MSKDLEIIVQSVRDDSALRRQISEAGARFIGKEDDAFSDWAFSLPKETVAVVVDDTEVRRAVLRDILNAVGVTVHVFARAEEALAKIPELDPDVVVTDVDMPGMNGIELTRKLRELYPLKAGA